MYQKINFKDRIDSNPTTYLVDKKPVIVEKDNTGLKQQGTLLNAESLNHLEDGIYNNSVDIKKIQKTVNGIDLKNIEKQFKEVDKKCEQAFQSGDKAKHNVVTALSSKDVKVTTEDTWEEISNSIRNIKQGDYNVGDTINKEKLVDIINVENIFNGENIKDIVVTQDNKIIIANHDGSMNITCVNENGNEIWRNGYASHWLYELVLGDNCVYALGDGVIYKYSLGGEILKKYLPEWKGIKLAKYYAGFLYVVFTTQETGGTYVLEKLDSNLERIFFIISNEKIADFCITDCLYTFNNTETVTAYDFKGEKIEDKKYDDIKYVKKIFFDNETNTFFYTSDYTLTQATSCFEKIWRNDNFGGTSSICISNYIYIYWNNYIYCMCKNGKKIWEKQIENEKKILKVCKIYQKIYICSANNVYKIKNSYKITK